MSVDEARLTFEQGGLGALNVIIGLIMFGVALDLRIRDFTRIARDPKGPLVGMVAQFFLLPFLTFLLTLFLKPAPSIALGMILIASCPGGNLSNFLTLLSKGNAAMSVSVTAVSTVLAIFLTPTNLAFWGRLNPETAAILKEIHLDPLDMFQTVLVILGIPTFIGMTTAHLLPSLAIRMHTPFKVFAIVAFLLFITIALVQNMDVFLKYVHWVVLAVAIQNAMALATGYWSAKSVGLPEADCRAISIEVGIQNSALGLILVFEYFQGLGGMALVAGWWGIWHVISGLTIASIWSRRPPFVATISEEA